VGVGAGSEVRLDTQSAASSLSERRITRERMRRLSLVVLLIVGLVAVGGADSRQATDQARAALVSRTTEPFTAVFVTRPCRSRLTVCGTGVIDGFGRVKTVAVYSQPTPGPEPGCQTFKGTRTVTLVKHRRSTLRFAVRGPLCGTRAWGPFTIVSGTGVFSHATGSGVTWGVSPLHYYGVIRLGR
jgi:hypothetical protein